jgi:hypothetical protein
MASLAQSVKLRVQRNASRHPTLRNMESRPEGQDLILEAQL